jgi:hypothetical protein
MIISQRAENVRADPLPEGQRPAHACSRCNHRLSLLELVCPTCGPEPVASPTPPCDDLLARIRAARGELESYGKSAGVNARGVRRDVWAQRQNDLAGLRGNDLDRAAQLAWVRGQMKGEYPLPAFEPLWMAAAALGRGSPPGDGHEPESGPEWLRASIEFEQWAQAISEGPGGASAAAVPPNGEVESGTGGAAASPRGTTMPYINLDKLDLSLLLPAVRALRDGLEGYRTYLSPSELLSCGLDVLTVERELARLGLSGHPGEPLATGVARRSPKRFVLNLREWLIGMRRGDTQTWGEAIPAGSMWTVTQDLPHMEQPLADLRAILQGLETAVRPEKTRQPRPTIWFHAGKSYSTDGHNPVCVTAEQHNVLKSFLDRNEALDTATLEKAGVCNVTSVINKLVEKFGQGPIRQPKRKGDGYYIRVRTRPKKKRDDTKAK